MLVIETCRRGGSVGGGKGPSKRRPMLVSGRKKNTLKRPTRESKVEKLRGGVLVWATGKTWINRRGGR